jgi:hypothetical protein
VLRNTRLLAAGQTAAISAVDLLQLLTSQALAETPSPSQVKRRLEELSSSQIGKVARYYNDHREELAPWKDSISKSIVSFADKSIITADFPPNLLAEVLLARDDLIDAETLKPLTNDLLDRLLREGAPPQIAERVIAEMLLRDMGDIRSRMGSRPQRVLLAQLSSCIALRFPAPRCEITRTVVGDGGNDTFTVDQLHSIIDGGPRYRHR